MARRAPGSIECFSREDGSSLNRRTHNYPPSLPNLTHNSYSFTGLDTETFKACPSVPCASSFPNAYRWYLHIAALAGIKTCVRAWLRSLLGVWLWWGPSLFWY